MRQLCHCLAGCLIGLALLSTLGCSSLLRPKGRVIKGGQPLHTGPGEGLRIIFEPVKVEGDAYNAYPAQFDGDSGTFVVTGKDGGGLPPGEYRISMQLMKKREDVFRGAYLGKKSPFICKVSSGSGEVVVDLDKGKVEE
jgi:hypothetical protein